MCDRETTGSTELKKSRSKWIIYIWLRKKIRSIIKSRPQYSHLFWLKDGSVLNSRSIYLVSYISYYNVLQFILFGPITPISYYFTGNSIPQSFPEKLRRNTPVTKSTWLPFVVRCVSPFNVSGAPFLFKTYKHKCLIVTPVTQALSLPTNLIILYSRINIYY